MLFILSCACVWLVTRFPLPPFEINGKTIKICVLYIVKMEDLLDILRNAAKLNEELNLLRQTHFEELDQLFFGIAPTETPVKAPEIVAPKQTSSAITPQQTKKRPKRLTSLAEDEDDDVSVANSDASQQSARMSNSQLLAAALEEEDEINTTGALMPPPPAPVAVAIAAETSISSGRPQRAAKLRSEKNLKEPTLNSKLRRPSHDEMIKVKVESEQRASQAHISSKKSTTQPEAVPVKSNISTEQVKPDESITKAPNLRVMVKREKLSCDSTATTTTTATLEATKTTLTDETNVLSTTAVNSTSVNNTTSASNTTAAPAKKGRKKKEGHKPIKVERFSDLDKNLPVSSRTRQGSNVTRNSHESQAPPQRSIYEDAIEALPNAEVDQGAVNKTVTVLPNVATGETTFNIPTGNATITLNDHMVANATFQVEAGGGDDDKEESMETARQGSMPKAGQESSLMTEDESLVDVGKTQTSKQLPPQKQPTSIKSKMPARTHELFNPLLQSPVKMRVEAFENAANAQTNLRSKRVKEVGTSGTSTTPVIGKLTGPTLGRFLTPTQSASALGINSAVAKKAPMSASKATVLTKSSTGTNLKSTNSSSNKTLSRENSGDDFRKGLHQLAEERKKQREQKHLQAAQQREARERERAERMARVAKEREEKRLKKEKLEERKRQEMEELQRKLYQQEEAERLKKAKAKEQERELLQQMKIQQQNSAKAKHMMPPPPKSKYTFEMLHEDDSTDDEGKVSHKRPPVPNWSRSHVRGAAIVMQSHCPTDVIDSFFSVAPTTPDLKLIFPNIDPSHLKRNSSVLWSTPPRYSELPKY